MLLNLRTFLFFITKYSFPAKCFYCVQSTASVKGRFSYDMTDEFFGPNSERSNKLAQFVGTTMQRGRCRKPTITSTRRIYCKLCASIVSKEQNFMTLNKEPITINITTIVRFCSSQNANRAYSAATETSGPVSE